MRTCYVHRHYRYAAYALAVFHGVVVRALALTREVLGSNPGTDKFLFKHKIFKKFILFTTSIQILKHYNLASMIYDEFVEMIAKVKLKLSTEKTHG